MYNILYKNYCYNIYFHKSYQVIEKLLNKLKKARSYYVTVVMSYQVTEVKSYYFNFYFIGSSVFKNFSHYTGLN